MTLQEIEDKKIVERIKFIKAKTDSFILISFTKKNRTKFQWEFQNCGYFQGEAHYIYQSLNSDKPNPDDLKNLTHNYSFFDREINLKTDLDIYFFECKGIEVRFQTTVDSLRYVALNKIYNHGLFSRIKAKATEVKFRNPYIVIQTDKKAKTVFVILKDKILPHNFFIL